MILLNNAETSASERSTLSSATIFLISFSLHIETWYRHFSVLHMSVPSAQT
jgi:hypothetical protein